MLSGYGPSLISGLMVTLKLALASFAVGLFIGLLGSWAKLSSIQLLRFLASLYTTIIRGTPELLVIFLIFYGGQVLISHLTGDYVEIPAFTAGVVALGTVFGGYCTESLRSAFSAVPKGLIESAKASGMNSLQIFLYIQLPLAWRLALPALGNLWLVLLKETALVSVIGLEDLMRKSQIAVSATKQPFSFYLAVALLYLLMTFFSERGLKIWENQLYKGERA